jgi:O-antigen/teichoic acid export membrane protein
VAGIILIGYLVSQQAETFFIGLYCSVEDVGFYTLAFRTGSLAGLLPVAFAYVLLPVIAEQFGSGEMEKLKKIYLTSSRYLMMVALPLAIGGIALANPIITLFYGADYRPAVILFQVISLPIAISSLAGAGDAVIRGINRPGFIFKTKVIFAIINIGLSLWLIPKYGILGAAIASSVPLVLGLPVYVTFISKTVGATWPVRDTIKITTASLIMGVAVYILHSHLGAALSLALCIPLGVVIYVIAIFVLRVIRKQDLAILRGIQNALPLALRKYYIPLVGLTERIVLRTKLAIDQ